MPRKPANSRPRKPAPKPTTAPKLTARELRARSERWLERILTEGMFVEFDAEGKIVQFDAPKTVEPQPPEGC